MNGNSIAGYSTVVVYPQAQSYLPGSGCNMQTATMPVAVSANSTAATSNTAQQNSSQTPLVYKQERAPFSSGDHINPLDASHPSLITREAINTSSLQVPGRYAFQDEPAGFNATLIVDPVAQQPLKKTLDFVLTSNAGSHVLQKYDPKNLKNAHYFLRSSDGTAFWQVHPRLENGHFIVNATFPKPGNYRLYAEVTPESEAHEAFHFDFPVDAVNQQAEADIVDQQSQNMNQLSGPYRLILRNGATSDGKTPLLITINKIGKTTGNEPRDLHPEAVFIDRSDESYSRDDAATIPIVQHPPQSAHSATFSIPTSLKPGNYQLYLMFSDGNKKHEVSYNITVKSGPMSTQ